MAMNRWYVLFSLLCLPLTLRSQRMLPYTWEDFLTMLTQDEEQHDDDMWNEWLEELQLLHERPLDINTASYEELLRIPTLNPSVIEQIHAYQYLYGRIQSMGELRLIPSITEEQLRVLPLFLYVDAKTALAVETNAIKKKKLKGRLEMRTDVPLYYRKGYRVSPGYQGNPLYHRVRAEAEYGALSAGFRMEKDPGETYFDSYGGFLLIQNKGMLKKALLGDYKVGFGQGLVIGKSGNWGLQSNWVSSSQGILPMRSMDECNYLRGVCAEFRLKPFWGIELTFLPILSYRLRDATLHSNQTVKTIQRTGLHRTLKEREDKGNFGHFVLGGHLQWKYKRISVGNTLLYQTFSRPLEPGNAVYRTFYPRGSRFLHLSTDYQLVFYRFQLVGEVAYSAEHKALATMHRLRYVLSRNFQMALLPRFYSYRYHSMWASAPVSVGSTPQNESGCTFSIQYQTARGFICNAYADASYHPWHRYGIRPSTSLFRGQSEMGYTFNSQHRISLRYQYKRGFETGNVLRTHQQGRLLWEYKSHARHLLQTLGLLHHESARIGWGVSQQWKALFMHEQLESRFHLTYFNTTDYVHRIWLYEPSLLGGQSNGAFSGHGIRYVCKFRWYNSKKQWRIELKMSTTYRFDTNEQGSGLQTIQSSWKTDVGFYSSYSF